MCTLDIYVSSEAEEDEGIAFEENIQDLQEQVDQQFVEGGNYRRKYWRTPCSF